MKKNVTILLVLCLLFASCSKLHKVKKTPDPVKVTVFVVGSQDDDYQTRSYSGTVESNQSTVLSLKTGGKVKQVFVKDGQKVKTGDRIALVDDTQAKNAYATAKSTLKQARDAYDRVKAVHDSGSVSEIKWVEVQTKLEQAESMAEIAKQNLEECVLTAPFSGVISGKPLGAGTNLLPSQPFVTLVQTDTVKIKVNIPENDINSVFVGQKADIRVAATTDTLTGKVSTIGVEADALSHTYPVTISVANKDGKSMPGMVCKVDLYNHVASESYVIPYQSVQLMPEGRYVWYVKDSKTERKMITTSGFSSGGVVVTSGIAAGDSIVVEGRQKVYEGGKIVVAK